ncbi:MAG: hypothetical protein EBZ78_09685 [Verrucomicrobia bacterium]|nr:hypothetical protein [Verrucomicrobiota bacterium]
MHLHGFFLILIPTFKPKWTFLCLLTRLQQRHNLLMQIPIAIEGVFLPPCGDFDGPYADRGSRVSNPIALKGLEWM